LTLLCVVDHIQPEEAAHWVAPTFLAEAFEGEPRILEPEKHTGLGWFALDALPTPLSGIVTVAVAALRERA